VGESVPGKMVEDATTIDDETKRKILADNALEFLGLSRDSVL
jgi:hypothetical protein